MATTDLPPSLGAPPSQYKIHCTTGSVKIGDREFLSATDALEAYLTQYEKQGLGRITQPLYKRTVSDLLDPKSALHMTAERSLQTGVRATDTEMRLTDQKDNINESLLKMKKSVALKAEVEKALNKSQEVINQINSDAFPRTTECPSDVGSLATDVLVNMSPSEGYNPTDVQGVSSNPAWKSKHVYGYKRPRARRSKTLSSLQIAHDMMGLTEEKPQQSFTAQPSDKSAHVTFQDDVAKSPRKYDDDVSILLGESPNTSRLSRSMEKNLRERSRSVSPSILKRERKMFESGLRDKPIPDFYTDFTVAPPKPPSWIDTLNLSDVSDSDWRKRDFTVSKPPPSWVNDIDNSDITSVVSSVPKPAKKLQFHDLLRPLPVIENNTQNNSVNSDHNDTLPPPGLTYKDLVGDTSKLANTQTNQERAGSPSLSEKLTNLKAKTDAALRKYHERVQSDINFDSPSKGSNQYTGDQVPRCSSLDTEALIAGVAPPGRTDLISGASPIVPLGDGDSTVTAQGSPSRARARARARSRSPDTDIILDGDRPWEKTVSYKPPVSVDTSLRKGKDDQNYSGGSQPGSLEALKNMIFKLQQEAIHTDSEDEGSRNKLSQRVMKLRAEAASLGISVPQDDKAGAPSGEPRAPPGQGGNSSKAPTGDIPGLDGYDFHGEPGGQSLEKALVHLDRLKNLVGSQDGSKQAGTAPSKGVTPLCASTGGLN